LAGFDAHRRPEPAQLLAARSTCRRRRRQTAPRAARPRRRSRYVLVSAIAAGRRNVVMLTNPGQAKLEEATEASDAAERELLAPLDEREAAQLRALLKRVTEGRAQR
jgi:hypothetical protein